jgi:hypothetical protein
MITIRQTKRTEAKEDALGRLALGESHCNFKEKIFQGEH